MKLLDAVLGRSERFSEQTASNASVLMTAFGSPDNEKILPTYLNAVSAYQNSGVVFGVLLTRLSLFSEAEFKFQRLSDKSLFGTPALAKLEKPWPGGSTAELLARMEQDASLAGNAYIRDAGEHLERLRPDWVTIVSEVVMDAISDTEVRRVVGYFYDPPPSENRAPAFYPEAEVAHWSPIPDPLAHFRGMSWLTPVLREVDADLQMTDYKRAYLTNAATPNLLIKYDKQIGQDKLNRLKDQIEARHGGVNNAFRTLVLDEGADTTVLGNNFEQMQFTAVQAAGENRIAVAGGVPGIVVGLKEGLAAATYSNYEQAVRRLGDITMRPLWRGAATALSKLVEVPSDARLWYDAAQVAALRQGDHESINASLSAGDITLLKHSGLVSVQMQTPGTTPTKEGP